VSRRDNAEFRCGRCRMLGQLCICALIPSPKIETRTRLVLFIHRYEDRKPTNTGRLATECLANSEVFVRGHDTAPSAPFVCDPSSRALLLFPHEDAKPLAPPAPGDLPVTLIVPDGTWRQASKVRKRVPGLRDMPCVSLPLGAPSIYRLRSEAHETGLATIEAIARAMDILEGAHVGRALELVFRAMVERTLWSRGECETVHVTGGIPEGVMRHDPRSGGARVD
jgi:DTW domain-containing protein YfiP